MKMKNLKEKLQNQMFLSTTCCVCSLAAGSWQLTAGNCTVRQPPAGSTTACKPTKWARIFTFTLAGEALWSTGGSDNCIF